MHAILIEHIYVQIIQVFQFELLHKYIELTLYSLIKCLCAIGAAAKLHGLVNLKNKVYFTRFIA